MNKDLESLIQIVRSDPMGIRFQEVIAQLRRLGPDIIPELLSATVENKLSPPDIGLMFSKMDPGWLKTLIGNLRTPDPALTKAIADSLAFFRHDSWRKPLQQAVPLLIQALTHSDKGVRESAARALGKISNGGAETYDALIHALTDSERLVRQQAALALGRLGPKAAKASKSLLSMTKDPDPGIRRYSIEALGAIGLDTGQILDCAMSAMTDPDALVRAEATTLLGSLARSDSKALRHIKNSLTDSDSAVRLSALEALETVGRCELSLEAPILNLAKDSDPQIRFKALETHWKVFRNPEGIVPLIVKRISDDGRCSQRICDLISEIGPTAEATVPALIRTLDVEDYDSLWAAVSALGSIGQGSRDAIPRLIALLNHPSGIVSGSSATALAKIGPAALPELLRLLDEDTSKNREFVLDTLGQMGKEASVTVPQLLRSALRSKNDGERCWAAIALGEIAGAREVVPTLIDCLESSSPQVCSRAARALGKIGRPALAARPTLQKLAMSQHPNVASEAAAALNQIR